MYEVSAHAVRVNDMIEVTVFGYLADSCHTASITDIYPGGKIVYIKDPGYAQVFITEKSKPNTQFCSMVLVPFAATTYIHSGHDEVQIFVNRTLVLKVKVVKKGAEFIVARLTGGIIPHGGCSIFPADAIYPAIYTKIFGPASYDRCLDYVAKECVTKKLPGLSIAGGGGSEAPRGLL